ncbi:hypothetical protein SEPCBS57363_003981 [Sporothrix epigloea]|uniref:histone acetyltransferase n=1 Tax=Sporothrix epigloea TaxID=1892477 RepID=A0ABP0DQU6_9PEZI
MADNLSSRLAAVLPDGHAFGVYHLSTPPTRTDALYYAPPGQRPDRTYIESHFLAVTVSPSVGSVLTKELALGSRDDEVVAFALEVFVFTTKYATTIFVAKADSSGYLHILGLPKGTPSPIRAVTSAFLAHLVENRQRSGVQCVVSLFARAQAQYLFPGSVDNPGKHVLDDRSLVRWWHSVLDPLLCGSNDDVRRNHESGDSKKAHGYLVVPGLDQYETRSLLSRRPGTGQPPHWTLGHPLETISHYCATTISSLPPPRCLIPRYPDDPKARYLDELDEEAMRGHERKSDAKDGKEQRQVWNGQWKSVRSLDQFWEMLAFRQECSSGRLTGFLWVVFPIETRQLKDSGRQGTASQGRKAKQKRKTRKALCGYIVSRRPRPKTQQRNLLAARPDNTPYYRWPVAGRGRLLVDETDYKRINELLLQLDFCTLEKSVNSTRRWVQEAGVGSGEWRMSVVGQLPAAAVPTANLCANTATLVTDLGGSIPRKRAPSEAEGKASAPMFSVPSSNGVNVLSAGLVRKKQKHGESGPVEPVIVPKAVNVLSAGLVRKKAKI